MSEMVELVANAIANGCDFMQGGDWCLEAAHAAIAALREPTPRMLRAGADAMPDMDRAPERVMR